MASQRRRGGGSAASFSVFYRRSALDALQRRLESVKGPGSRRLARRLEEVARDGNERDRLRGVDVRGRPLRDWRVRKGRYARWTNRQPLVPFGTRSDAIAGFFCRVTQRFGIFGRWRIRAGINSAKADIFVYHARGIRTRFGRIRRNILGFTPKTRSELLAELARFVREGGRYR